MRLSLGTKIGTTLVGVLALAVLSSVVALALAWHLDATIQALVFENVESVRGAEELEIALLEQRGYVSAYLLDDGNRQWLEELAGKQQAFRDWLEVATETAHTEEERRILARLKEVHHEYSAARDRVIELYDAGETERAKRALLEDVTELYAQAYALCEEFIEANQRYIHSASGAARTRFNRLLVIVLGCIALTVGLGVFLLWLFFQGVFFPLRRMAADARLFAASAGGETPAAVEDELRAVGVYLRTLMADVTQARRRLDRSRTQLLQAEKLASVGKLAASVAHEIRNPLTSIKMWLYSIRRACGEEPSLEQKFDLVSDEIHRLESVVHNFLEFSRPPDLKLAEQSVPRVIDKTLELLRHRLAERRIEVTRDEASQLPVVRSDAEQLQQVLINLLNNAVDAMPSGGTLRIRTRLDRQDGHTMVVIHVQDTGLGMPAEVQGRIFEPFFTNKEHGTGLGLCIAASIMARHGGRLVLESTSPAGTEFAAWIPAAGSNGA